MATPKQKAAARLPILEVAQLSDLEQLSVAEPIQVEVEMFGRRVRIVGRRLKPSETKEIQLLLERALPPALPGKGDEPDRFDLRDPAYLEAKETHRRQARALAIYQAYPAFKQGYDAQAATEGGQTDAERIMRFIESREVEDDYLEVLFRAVIERKVEASRYVGFTSGNSSRGA
jgi:hypothetical protein